MGWAQLRTWRLGGGKIPFPVPALREPGREEELLSCRAAAIAPVPSWTQPWHSREAGTILVLPLPPGQQAKQHWLGGEGKGREEFFHCFRFSEKSLKAPKGGLPSLVGGEEAGSREHSHHCSMGCCSCTPLWEKNGSTPVQTDPIHQI